MIDNFLLLKLNRSIWISLLDQEKIIEGINYFETYMNNLASIQTDKNYAKPVSEEMGACEALFIMKMLEIADKFFEKKDYSNALICYTALFKYCQEDVDLLKNYIECLNQLKLYDLATELIKHLEQTVPEDEDVYKFLADFYDKKNDCKKTIFFMEKYFNAPDCVPSAQDYNLLGCYYNKLYSQKMTDISLAKKSMDCFVKASELEPNTKLYAKNVTILAVRINDSETGKKYWNRVFELGKINNDDKYDYAAFCLRRSDFDGWKKYFGSRFQKETNPTAFPKLSKQEWKGDKSLYNSTILVYFEQGFGDTFLMWGYMSRLVKMAKHVIFVVQDAIYPLLKDNDLGVEVLSKSSTDLSKLKYDCWIPSMSIPVALNLEKDNISVGEGFIKVKEEEIQKAKEKYFNTDKLKIGISFKGSPIGNHFRDIPIGEFLMLDKLDNIEIYSLTKDIPDDAFECFKSHKVHNIAKDFKNFEDTAAAMMNLDVVVTADNCLLNLAGALGLKTFGLFNWQYEFRWYNLAGKDSGWLTSVKPFICPKISDWATPMSKIVNEIKTIK